MDCLFCDLISKKKPSYIIYEDEWAVGILDAFPRAIGHTIVLPRQHAENILELSDDQIGKVFEAVKKVTLMLKEKINPDGFTIGINHGKVSGQAIDHLHIHIIPRFRDDGGGSIHSVVNNPPQQSLEQIKEKIIS
jgi:histidine triad (HIT) family protein